MKKRTVNELGGNMPQPIWSDVAGVVRESNWNKKG